MEVCTFCDIDIKASLLPEHIDMCSSRTERCNDCGKFIMLKSATIHKESHKLKKVPNGKTSLKGFDNLNFIQLKFCF